jgi:prepilin-type N-terminal cleavage/methylation domain-containing protein
MKTGFTLLELLIVIAIGVIVAGFIFTAFVDYGNEQSFRATVVEMVAITKEARQKTLSAETTTQFGVHFASSSLVVFEGGSYDPASSSNKIYNFSNVSLTPELSSGGSEVVFARLSGEASATGTIEILNHRSNSTTSILIRGSGLVE